jgi:Zn-dependent protease/CBS domain-containing protein
MFGNAWKFGRIHGIDLRVHSSWIVIALLIAWNLWSTFVLVHDRGEGAAIAMAVAGAVLFFASILVHELAHALEAQRRGVEVGGITLFLFGGVTESRFNVGRPVDEFALTIVGPLSSFVLAGAFWGVTVAAGGGDLERVAEVTGLLGWLNLALGVFNLLPGAPLDGGRLLRSIVWWRTGDRQRSVRVASNAGRVLGGGLIALGLLELLVLGAFVGGLWLAFIGWFLFQAATAERTEAELAEVLDGVTVERLLRSRPPHVDAGASVREAADEVIGADDDLVLVDTDGRPSGVVDVDDIRRVPRAERATTLVTDIMVPTDELPSIDTHDDARELLDRMSGPGADRLLVRDHGRPVGVLTAPRVATTVRRMARVGGEPSRHRPARPVASGEPGPDS